MIYPYHCIICDMSIDILKPASQCADEEICPKCLIVMDRVWTVPRINMLAAKDHKDGLVCVGNDRQALSSISPKTDYDLPPEVTSKFEG